MSYSPIAHAESLRIGTVDYISPDEVKVYLDIDAPESVALNAGGARPFPRVNGYVLIPVDDGFLVGQIEWLTIERANFPKRKGVQDFGVIDLPYPLRKMSLNPLGMLRKQPGGAEGFEFRRGADALPSIGSPVLLPTSRQLKDIVESGKHRRVLIGTSPLAGDAEVKIDPDRLFGRHLAVLGNTGSGKSCSVAGLIRWSLEAAKQEREEDTLPNTNPNARFIILDPNGEYSRAFSDTNSEIKAKIFKVNPGSDVGEALKVPLWFWNSAEWSSFTQASARTQRPLLKRGLREIKVGHTGINELSEEEKKLSLRRYLTSALISIRQDKKSGEINTKATQFGFGLKARLKDFENKRDEYPEQNFNNIIDAINEALDGTFTEFTDRGTGKHVEYYRAFTEEQADRIIDSIKEELETIGGIIYQEGPDEDIPLPFNGADLADHIQMLAEEGNQSQYVDFFISRIRTFLADPRIKSVIGDSGTVEFHEWLSDYIGGDEDAMPHLAILDLSLVPSDIIHVVTAVTARIIFDALQRYQKLNGAVLPTVMVMEEAHTFIRRYKEDAENYDAASVCCQVFERIAREGRKFGLGLVVSSQRPSELSPTVLSQCNTFLLHRISNDRDQELVHRMVPDNLRGLLRELPSLPSRHAVLMGWASELPILVNINELSEDQRPQSDDPDYWNVWTGTNDSGEPVSRDVNWKDVADDWQGKGEADAQEEPEETE